MTVSHGFKDLFSGQAVEYARYRPTYPAELFAWVVSQIRVPRLAVDVATGNGQAAVALAHRFERVVGIDPSAAQLKHAKRDGRVDYVRATAEQTGLAEGCADVLTAAQAFHWFRRDAFFAEARRVVRPGGVVAVWTYFLPVIARDVDRVVHDVYEHHLGQHWEPERRLVEDGYASVPFPPGGIPSPPFSMRATWTYDDLAGFLATWSAARRYASEKGGAAFRELLSPLRKAWGSVGERQVWWPFWVRAFRV